MARQLNVRSDHAYELAHQLARRLGLSVTQVVEKALHDYKIDMPAIAEAMTAKQRAVYESLRAASIETAKRKIPGATSDHSDLYDEDGLPI